MRNGRPKVRLMAAILITALATACAHTQVEEESNPDIDTAIALHTECINREALTLANAPGPAEEIAFAVESACGVEFLELRKLIEDDLTSRFRRSQRYRGQAIADRTMRSIKDSGRKKAIEIVIRQRLPRKESTPNN